MSLPEILTELKRGLTVDRRRKPLYWRDTGTATTFQVFAPGAPHKVLEVRFHTAALAAAETLTITKTRLDTAPASGTYYNTVLVSEDLGTDGTTDLIVIFGPEEGFCDEFDTLVPALSANTGSDRWGLEIVYELVKL